MLSESHKSWFFISSIPKVFWVVIFYIISLDTMAYEWYWQPEVSFTQGYDENPALRIDDTLSSRTSRVNIYMQTSLNTERRLISLLSRFSQTQYDRFLLSDQENSRTKQRDNQFTLSINQNFLRSSLSFSYNNIKDESFNEFENILDITNEDDELSDEFFENNDVQEIDNDGLTGRDSLIRKTSVLSTSWHYQLSEISLLNLSIQNTEVDYNRGVDPITSDALFDYDLINFNVNFQRQITPVTTLFSGLTRQDYSTSDFENKSISDSVIIGVNWRLNPTVVLNIDLGYRTTKSQRAGVDTPLPGVIVGFVERNEENGRFANLSLQKQFFVGSFELSFSNSISPNSRGSINERNQVLLALNSEFNEKLTTSISLRYSRRNTFQFREIINNENDFQVFNFSLNYQISPRYVLTTSLSSTQLDFNNNLDAESKIITIGFRFQGKRQSLSY